MFEITTIFKTISRHVFNTKFSSTCYSYLHPGLQWQHKHTIDTGLVDACHWVSRQHLAVCMVGCVKVYEVTTQGSQLAYQLSSVEWKGKYTMGVAVSDSLPDSMLVICVGKPYVYQFPCHQATQEVKKYKIQGDRVNPRCIVANANTAAVDINADNTIIICSLPDFTIQSHVQTHFKPYDLSINTDKLLVMGTHEMVVKPLANMKQDLCKMMSPDWWMFTSVCFRNDATEIYIACTQGGKGCVYRYKWDAGKSQYVNMGCVIDGMGWVWDRCLSVTSDGLFALYDWGHSDVKVYSLE